MVEQVVKSIMLDSARLFTTVQNGISCLSDCPKTTKKHLLARPTKNNQLAIPHCTLLLGWLLFLLNATPPTILVCKTARVIVWVIVG